MYGFPPRSMPPGRPYPGIFDWTPVGSVIAYAGLTTTQAGQNDCHAINPEAWGWILCDGRELNVSDYPELFAVLGFQYGGNNQDKFNLPDYRGMFLRGVSDGKGAEPYVDPDIDQRQVPPGGSGQPDQVGSFQLDAVQTHEHIYQTIPSDATPTDPADSAGAVGGQPKLTEGGPTSSLSPPGNVKVSPHETRGRNVFVNFLVKYSNFPAWTGPWNYSPFNPYLPWPPAKKSHGP